MLYSIEFCVEISDISDCETGQIIRVLQVHNFMVKGNSVTVNICYNCIRLLIATVPRTGKEGNHSRIYKFFCSAEIFRPALRTSRSPT